MIAGGCYSFTCAVNERVHPRPGALSNTLHTHAREILYISLKVSAVMMIARCMLLIVG